MTVPPIVMDINVIQARTSVTFGGNPSLNITIEETLNIPPGIKSQCEFNDYQQENSSLDTRLGYTLN